MLKNVLLRKFCQRAISMLLLITVIWVISRNWKSVNKWSITRGSNIALDGNENFLHHRAPSLSEISLLFDSDKGPNGHNFTRIYERHFAPLREQRIRFLEIGIYKGGSIKLWESYFQKAELHFIDITDAYLQYNLSSRSQLHLLDQNNRTALREFANRMGQFDVIIDDGGHRMNQQIDTFQAFFKMIKPGGMYIIEDLHSSYWRSFGGNGDVGEPQGGSFTAIGFLKDLVDRINYVGAFTGKAAGGQLPELVRRKMDFFTLHIDSIQFYDSICIIVAK